MSLDQLTTSVSATVNPGSLETNDDFVLPASFGQERYWDLDRQKPGNPTWMVPVRFRLQGRLQAALVVRAFNEIVRRHEPLRTTFTLIDRKLSQVIRPSLTIAVPVTDLRHLPKPERDREVDRLSLEEARRGFDLTTGPLIRVSLIQASDDEHVLLVTPHHAVADYWSIGLISNELGALYEAYSRGTRPILPELTVQYGDYAVWQHEQADSTIMQDELAYWKKQLEGLPGLEMPLDRSRPSSPTYDATITSILLPVNLTDAMKEIANQAGSTFFNTMLAALGVVLSQYTGQTDFGVGTQVAGRNSVELEPLIGLFINTVVLRLDLEGDPRFIELAGRVQETGVQSLAHQNVRFEQVLRELRPGDYPSHHGLFHLNFICQRDPVKPLEFSGIKLTVIPSKSQGALYDLNVFLVLRTEGWRLACEYNTDLFEAATINQLLADYRFLLENIRENPNCKISAFPLCEGVLRARQHQAADLPPDNLPAKKETAKAMPPESLGAAAASAEEVEVSASSGAGSPPAPEECHVMPASAVQRRFCTLEEIAPGNPALHMRACVRLTGALSHAALERSLNLLADRHEILRTTFEKIDDDLVQVIAPSRQIHLYATSLEDMKKEEQEEQLRKEIRAETSASFDLAHGPLLRAHLFRLGPLENVLVLTTHHIVVDGWSQNVIQRDLWTTYEALVNSCEPSLPRLTIQYADFVRWQQDWLATDVARGQLDFWLKKLASPLPMLDIPVDASTPAASAPAGPIETRLLPEDLVRSLKSLAQAEEATMFMVMLTAYCALLSQYAGQEEILILSPTSNRKPETEPLIGPFAGPMSLRIPLSGNPPLRELLDRVRNVTIEALNYTDVPFEGFVEELDVRSVHGRNPLSQCYFFYQTAFLQPRQLQNLTVTPLPDFSLGTHFDLQMGVLERREGIRAQLEYNPALFNPAKAAETLRVYEGVLQIFVADPSQRLSELSLPAPSTSQFVRPERPAKPRITLPGDDTESKLVRIWENLLHVRPIGTDQDYFELGGNSLLAVRLFSEIHKEFQVKLPLSTLIESRTIQALAQILRLNGPAGNWSPLVAIQPRGSHPPFFCVHGGGGNVLIYRDLSRYLGTDQPFYGLQSQGLDGQQPLLTRVQDMAELYVREIQKVQPHGPYFLGGYCMGGTVAFEMAQQLKTRGEEVALLALFDTLNWSKLSAGSIRKKIYYELERYLFHVQNFLLLSFEGKLKFLGGKFRVLRSRTTLWKGMLSRRLSASPEGSMSESRLLARLWETNDRAGLEYVPRPYPGVITDFRPMKQYTRYNEPGVYWEELALGGQEIVTLPVYPAGMLLEPFVKDLAAVLEAHINRAMVR